MKGPVSVAPPDFSCRCRLMEALSAHSDHIVEQWDIRVVLKIKNIFFLSGGDNYVPFGR